MMKIIYIANIRLPTEKAHGVQIMEMCHAFAALGVEVELVVPKRKNSITEDPFAYYGIQKNFTVTSLPTLDLVQFGKIGFLLQSLSFALAAFWYFEGTDAVIYSRDATALYFFALFHHVYAYEIHAASWNFVTQSAAANALLLVPISFGLRDFYTDKGILSECMTVAHDGVDLKHFASHEKIASRKKLGLPVDCKIALYAGHLYERKGAHNFADAAETLGDDVLCVFVGGTIGDVEAFQKKFGQRKNIRILGHKHHNDIPYYLQAADVLVLPNSAKSEDARVYSSPMKLFEYMASGTPIVASDVQSIREVLTEKNALLVAPDDPEALAGGINNILKDSNIGASLASEAKKDVRKFTWEKRAKLILQGLGTVTK